MCCRDLRTNSDCFLLQHYLIGFCNGRIVFTARYELNLRYDLGLSLSLKGLLICHWFYIILVVIVISTKLLLLL